MDISYYISKENFVTVLVSLSFFLYLLLDSSSSIAAYSIYDVRLENDSLTPYEIKIVPGQNIILKFYNYDSCLKKFISSDLAEFYSPVGGYISQESKPGLETSVNIEGAILQTIPKGDNSGLVRAEIHLKSLKPGKYCFLIASNKKTVKGYITVED